MANLSNLFSKNKIIDKIKKIKHFDILLIVLLSIVVIIIWFGDFGKKTNPVQANTQLTTKIDYANSLESKLSNVLSDIIGAGSVSVMITLDGSSELILAYNLDKKNNITENKTTNGTVSKTETNNTTSTPIIINKNGQSIPLVLTEILPKIKGVVVIAEGANDIRVKMDILKAVQALLDVDSSQVEIFVKNKGSIE